MPQITIQEILALEQAAGRSASKPYWTRQFVDGRIAGAEKVHLNHTNALVWVCELSAYQQFVIDNLILRDVDMIISELRTLGKLETGLDGWYPLEDAAIILQEAGYKKTSYQSLRRYCNEEIIPFQKSRVYGKRAIAIEVLRNWERYRLPQGRPVERVTE